MARTSTYLNFPGTTEAAFHFYKSVFGTEFDGEIYRMGSGPQMPGQAELSESEKNLVMHVSLPILGGHMLMGTDAVESMGFHFVAGNNVMINLEPDTRAEADRLFSALSAGGTIESPLKDESWGAYFGACTDKFGTHWMINCDAQ